MAVTQEPTLTPVDTGHNQFQVQFGLEMKPGENTLDVTVPNLGGLTGADVFVIDFQKVNTPARGNFPAFRCIQFVLQTAETGVGSTAGAVYIVNPRTSQVLAIDPPAPTAAKPSVVFASVPFFAMSNQSVLIYRAASTLSISNLSATAFTFDTPSFYSSLGA